ncbi:MAG: putative Ig domain-containing protein [Synergistaceae bacterium]|nr:putative Ig domain-containing protein [Synergistaceae bacterium]
MRRIVVFLLACMFVAVSASSGFSAVALDEENFPDSTFRSYLSKNFDANEDGILSNNEILSIKEIYINSRNNEQGGVRSYQGIKKLTSLERFETYYYHTSYYNSWHRFTGDTFTELDLSGMKSLKYVKVNYGWHNSDGIRYDVGAKKINVSGCTSLQELYCYFWNDDGVAYYSGSSGYMGEGFLESLDASGCTSLVKLYCSNQQLKELNVKGCTALNYLDCGANKLPELDLSECTALQKLYCSGNKLTELDLSANVNLVEVQCYDNLLALLNVRNCPSLQILNCVRNQLLSLNVSNNTALTYLHCHHNKIQALDISSNKKLESLNCQNNRLPLLDTAVNTSLKTGSDSNGDYCKFSPQNIDGLAATRQSDGTYAVNLRDYLSTKIKNVVALSIYAKDDDGKLHDPVSYNEKTGIAVFDTPPATVYYKYDTKFDKDNTKRYMGVTLAASGSPVITTNSLPYATVGNLYAMEIEARGEKPITLSMSGNLPEGLTFTEETGEITGTPTTAGRYTVTVTAANDFGTHTRDFILYVWTGENVPIPAVIITPSLDDAVKGTPYSAKLEAAGDTPITWTASGLPAGLVLSASTGEISGTLTASGTFTFSATATNAAGSDTRELKLKVTETSGTVIAPSITTDENLGSYMAGDSVSVTLEAAGTSPLKWEHTGGTLPTGLSLSEVGTITGTASTAGTYSFTLKVSNSEGSDSRAFTMTVETVAVAPTIMTAQDLGAFEHGDEVTVYLTATGTEPMTWTASGLPLWLTLDASTGKLSGIAPEQTGKDTFTVTVTNSKGSDSRTFTLQVKAKMPTITAPAITTSSLTNGKAGEIYNATLTATGTSPITWTVTGLPDGLTANTSGKLTGIPKSGGTFTVVVTAENSGGKDSKEYTLTIEENNKVNPPKITTETLSDATVGDAYSFTLTAEGRNIAWTATFKTLQGFSITNDGILTGTPTASGTYNITVKAKNSAGTDYANLTLKVNSAGGNASAPAVKSSKIPDAYQGEDYSYFLEAEGTNLTWKLADGESLPGGLELTEEGEVTGKVDTSKATTFKFKVTATNEGGTSDAKQISLKVVAKTPTFKSDALKEAKWNKKYSFTLKVRDMKPTVWSIEGDLPEGVKFDKGKFSGTPKEAGEFELTISASNGAVEISDEFTLNVKGVTPKIKGSFKKGTEGEAYRSVLKATGVTPLTWDFDELPEGLDFTTNATGEECTIFGTHERSFSGKIQVTVENGSGDDQTAGKGMKMTIKAVKPKFETRASEIPDGVVGERYEYQLQLSTKNVEVLWSYTGNMPNGLTIDEDTGLLYGTPTSEVKNSSFKVTVTNANKPSYKSTLNITMTIHAEGTVLQSAKPEDPEGSEFVNGVAYHERGELTNEMLARVSNADEMIAAILPAIDVEEDGMYEFTVLLDVNAPEGGLLVWHSFPDGEDDEGDDDNAVFLDEDGEVIERVPETYTVTVSAWLEPGIIYEPIIAAKIRK